MKLESGYFSPYESVTEDEAERIIDKINEIEKKDEITETKASVDYQNNVSVFKCSYQKMNGYVLIKDENYYDKFKEGGLYVLNDDSSFCAMKVTSMEKTDDGLKVSYNQPDRDDIIEDLDISYGGKDSVNEQTSERNAKRKNADSSDNINKITKVNKPNLNFEINPTYYRRTDTNKYFELAFTYTFDMKDIRTHVIKKGKILKLFSCKYDYSDSAQVSATFTNGIDRNDKGQIQAGEGDDIKIAEKPLIIMDEIGLEIDFEFYLHFKLSNILSYKLSADHTAGLLYDSSRGLKPKGSFKTYNQEQSFGFVPQGEIGFSPKLKLKVLGLYGLAGFSANGGLGFIIYGGPEVFTGQYCMDAGVYVYTSLRFFLGDDDAKLPLAFFFGNNSPKLSIGVNIPIWGKDNSKFRKIFHIEDGKIVDHCTRKHGSIQGRVIDPAVNTGKANVRIEIKDSDGDVLYKTKTGPNGVYKSGEVTCGDYKLTATGQDKSQETVSITVGEGKNYIENIFF